MSECLGGVFKHKKNNALNAIKVQQCNKGDFFFSSSTCPNQQLHEFQKNFQITLSRLRLYSTYIIINVMKFIVKSVKNKIIATCACNLNYSTTDW